MLNLIVVSSLNAGFECHQILNFGQECTGRFGNWTPVNLFPVHSSEIMCEACFQRHLKCKNK